MQNETTPQLHFLRSLLTLRTRRGIVRALPLATINIAGRILTNESHSIAAWAAAWESPQRCRSKSIACDWYVNSKWQLCTGNWMESTSGPGSKNVNRSCSYLFVQHPSNGILPRSDVFTPFSARSSCLRCHRSEAIESDFVFTFPGTGHAEEWK